jgi:hypothetical protein
MNSNRNNEVAKVMPRPAFSPKKDLVKEYPTFSSEVVVANATRCFLVEICKKTVSFLNYVKRLIRFVNDSSRSKNVLMRKNSLNRNFYVLKLFICVKQVVSLFDKLFACIGSDLIAMGN